MSSSTRYFANGPFAAGAVAALVALALARGLDRGGAKVEHSRRSLPTFHTARARFALLEGGARLRIESLDAKMAADADLALEADGRLYPFRFERDAGYVGRPAAVGNVRIPLGGSAIDVRTEIATEPDQDGLTVRAIVPAEAARLAAGRLAIRVTVLGEPTDVFVSGFGVLERPAEAYGTATLIDFPPHPLALTSADGPVRVRRGPEEGREAEISAGVAVMSPRASEADPQAMLHVLVGQSSAMVWQPLLRSARLQTSPVRGHVTGARGERARVVGRDALGVPRLWARAREDGSFAVDAPASVVEWGATLGPSNVRQLVHYVPGEPAPLDLNLAPAGGVRVMVRDADTREPLTVRLLVEPVDAQPEGGRRSGPLSPQLPSTLDVLRGDTTATLRTGRYRIVATKGIEWSVDAREVDVVVGQAALVELYLRHVVPTPGVIACDLHTHARPSFDSQSSPEDSVLSLVAAGIDFAVSTAHNVVSDYEHAVAALKLGKEFASVPGVEVTTYNPRFGHFGVFPVSTVPPFERTNLQSITQAVRSDRSRYFQLNHPRLPGGIGYFDTIGLDPNAVRERIPVKPDFDGIEVYNGFDIEQPARVEEVLRDYWALLDEGWHYTATGDSDSHCLQYRCAVKVLDHTLESGAGAGYPRTMVTVEPPDVAGHDPQQDNLDPTAIIENLKDGHATVTSGPLIDLTLEGVGPGDELPTETPVVHGHLRVRAALWVDVTQVQIVAGSRETGWRIVDSFDVASRPTEWGPGPGTLEQAQARAVRFERDIDVPVGATRGWVQAIARGSRRMSDVLPGVEVAPLAFTNPVYVVPRAETNPDARGGAGPVTRKVP